MGKFGGDIEGSGFAILEAGNYQGKIEEIVEKTSSKGNEYLQITYVLDNGRKVWDNLNWASDAALNVCKGKLESLGFNSDQRHMLSDDITEMKVAVYDFVKDNNYEIKIGISKQEGFSDKNIVKSVKKLKASKIPF